LTVRSIYSKQGCGAYARYSSFHLEVYEVRRGCSTENWHTGYFGSARETSPLILVSYSILFSS